MGKAAKQVVEAVEEPEEDGAEAKKKRRAAKRAAKEAAESVAVEEPEVDEAEAKKQRKAAKRAAREAAEAAVAEPEVDEAEAKKQRKAAKRAAKEAAEPVAVAEEDPAVDEVEAKKQRKAAKRAAKEAAAAAAEEPEADDAQPKKKKAMKRAAGEEVDEDEANAPKSKKSKGNDGEANAPQEDGKGKGGSKGNKEFEVFVGGLPFTATEAALKKDFEECGAIASFRMPLNDEGKPRGIAFIEFKDAESVDKALQFHETEYGGRWIIVKKAGDTSKGKGKDGKGKDGKGKDGKGKGKGNKEFEVFVGGLSWSCTEDVVKKDFGECGEIVDFRMPLNDEGNPRGIAFIEYKDKESCDKAIKFNNTDYAGRTLNVRMSSDPPPAKGEGKKGKGNRELETFVGGLSRETTEESLKKVFAKCGEIVNFRLPLNDEGTARGIAFIEWKDKEALDKALEMNETEIDGRSIGVKKSGDGKGDGKDGKGKGKGKKGKKGGMSAENKAARDGSIVAAAGTKQTFADSDDE